MVQGVSSSAPPVLRQHSQLGLRFELKKLQILQLGDTYLQTVILYSVSEHKTNFDLILIFR